MVIAATISLAACSSVSSSSFISSFNSPSSSLVDSSSDSSSSIKFFNSGNTNYSYSEFNEALTLHAVNELRNPADVGHYYQSKTYANDENYLAFKNKFKVFAAKLSESFVKREYTSEDNISLSPLSIELCVGLAIYAATGQTRQELLNVFDIDFATFNTYYKVYFDELNRERKNSLGEIVSQLLLTNSIWMDKNVEFINKGLDDLKNDYYCYAYQADFKNQNKESCDDIAEFIYNKTKGLIRPDLQLSTETLFVLMNTLYLKDVWNDGSELSYTVDEYDFINGDGSKTKKRLLGGHYYEGKALETSDYTSFYTKTDANYSLYFVKPNAGKNIKDIFNKDTISYVLDSGNYIYKDDEKMEKYYTQCLFPEYQASCKLDLKKMFKEDFNVNALFDPNGTLNNVCQGPAYVQDFVHIAKLEVNKRGIEGAAVTYMAYAGAAYDPYQRVNETFVVDKEFGFIVTSSDGSVLFSGIVSSLK